MLFNEGENSFFIGRFNLIREHLKDLTVKGGGAALPCVWMDGCCGQMVGGGGCSKDLTYENCLP